MYSENQNTKRDFDFGGKIDMAPLITNTNKIHKIYFNAMNEIIEKGE
jgi:hypothetical protein